MNNANKLRLHFRQLTKVFNNNTKNLSDDEILKRYLFEDDYELLFRKMSFEIEDETTREITGKILGIYRTAQSTFYVLEVDTENGTENCYIEINRRYENELVSKEKMLKQMRRQIDVQCRIKDRMLRIAAVSSIILMIVLVIIVRMTNRPDPLILDFYDGHTQTYENSNDLYEEVAEAVVLIEVYSANTQAGSSATGMFISQDGYILSCAHIYDDIPNPKFMVTLNDGTMQQAILIAGDVEADVCLLKIARPDRKYHTVKFANSDELETGETSYVIGFPGGISVRPMLTKGVVSATDVRKTNLAGYSSSYIQTDAAANPGNSGGGLFNEQGLVVGIVSIKNVSYDYDNTAYCVPSRIIKRVINDLYYKGHVIRPTLGITISDPLPQDVEAGLPYGSKVVSVNEASDAYDKIVIGDIITKINGVAITPLNTMLDVLEDVNEDNLNIVLEVYSVEKHEYYVVEFRASIRFNETGYVTEVPSEEPPHEHQEVE